MLTKIKKYFFTLVTGLVKPKLNLMGKIAPGLPVSLSVFSANKHFAKHNSNVSFFF